MIQNQHNELEAIDRQVIAIQNIQSPQQGAGMDHQVVEEIHQTQEEVPEGPIVRHHHIVLLQVPVLRVQVLLVQVQVRDQVQAAAVAPVQEVGAEEADNYKRYHSHKELSEREI